MTNKLPKVNIILLAITLGIAVLYAGFECFDYLFEHLRTVSADNTGMVKVNISYLISTFHYPVVFTVLLFAGIYWGKEQHYPNVYSFAVKCTFIYPAAYFIFAALSYNAENIDHHTEYMDCFVVPGIILAISVVVSINYFICFRKAKDIYEDF